MSLLAEASFSRRTRLQGVSQGIVRVGNYGFTADEFEVLIVSVELVLSLVLLIFVLYLDDDWMRAGIEEARRELRGERICPIFLVPASTRVMRIMKALLVAGLVTHGRIHGVGGCGTRIRRPVLIILRGIPGLSSSPFIQTAPRELALGLNDDDLFRLLLQFDRVIRVTIVALDERTIGLEDNLAYPMC